MKTFPFQADEENKNYATLLSELENIKYKGKSLVPRVPQAVWGEDKYGQNLQPQEFQGIFPPPWFFQGNQHRWMLCH